jgi:hypothetical protein
MVQVRLSYSANYATLMRESRWEFTAMLLAMSSATLFRIARQDW